MSERDPRLTPDGAYMEFDDVEEAIAWLLGPDTDDDPES